MRPQYERARKIVVEVVGGWPWSFGAVKDEDLEKGITLDEIEKRVRAMGPVMEGSVTPIARALRTQVRRALYQAGAVKEGWPLRMGPLLYPVLAEITTRYGPNLWIAYTEPKGEVNTYPGTQIEIRVKKVKTE